MEERHRGAAVSLHSIQEACEDNLAGLFFWAETAHPAAGIPARGMPVLHFQPLAVISRNAACT